ncbi:MAG: hypothetical protein NC127_02155 [Muribaculum sp.]|nr:hypothetical protein [Muribaculum sp.]
MHLLAHEATSTYPGGLTLNPMQGFAATEAQYFPFLPKLSPFWSFLPKLTLKCYLYPSIFQSYFLTLHENSVISKPIGEEKA